MGFAQQALVLGSCQDPAHHRLGNGQALPFQQQHELVLAGTRPALAHCHNRREQLGGVGGSPGAPGPAAAVLKALQVARVVARPPAVERLPADAEMPAGQGDVVALAVAELEPLKSLPGCFGELHRRLGQAQEP